MTSTSAPRDGPGLPLPTFVVIGAMRSGSTSLYKYLQDHPEIFMPRKEIHFFDRRWDRGLDWYRSRFEGYDGQPAVGEATPTYISDPVALDRMTTVLPRAQLVAVLRDPVDRAYSHYWMERARERESRSFEAAVDDEQRGVGGSDYLARGRYAVQLDDVFARFPRQQVHLLLLDDLHDHPAETYADVCRFLGVDVAFASPRLGDRVNHFVSFRSHFLRRHRRRLTKRFKVNRAVDRLNAVHDAYPDMDASTRQRLTELFDSDNRRLETILGRDLGAWRQPIRQS